MKLQSLFLAASFLIGGSVAFADTTTTTTIQQQSTLQAVPAPIVTTQSTSGYACNGLYENRSINNYGDQSGNGSTVSSTLGVDYGVGRDFVGPLNNNGYAVAGPCSSGINSRLRSRSVGFAPHKNRWSVYDNQVSVALPLVR